MDRMEHVARTLRVWRLGRKANHDVGEPKRPQKINSGFRLSCGEFSACRDMGLGGYCGTMH